MKGQYGNSVRFRLLKWLNPLLSSAVFAAGWFLFYVPDSAAAAPMGTHAAFLAVYLVILMWLDKTYHALTIGLLRVSELVYSQALSLFICNVMCYVMGSVYLHRLLPIVGILVIMAVQFGVCVGWSVMANNIYYRVYPAPSTVIVYRRAADLERVRSIRYFSEHFDVKKEIGNPQMSPEALIEALRGYSVVFVAGIESTLRNDIAKFCVINDVKGYFVPRIGDLIMAGADFMSTFSEPVMKVQRVQTKKEYWMFKRLIDIAVSLVGIIIAGPIMAVTALAIRLNDGGPVFYRQNRLTQNGRVFSILKFRSMNVNAEKDGVARLASENDSRITPVGRFIRATRIDELPQLINILRGDMSLVGPRPERPEIAAEYQKELPEFELRLQVKAGLTGMAQVYGRYNTEPYSKLEMDLIYINRMSFMTDVSLIFSTVKILFMKESTAGVESGRLTAASAPKEDSEEMTA